ncbi:hypothetical protein MTO96_008495 [Rhipicephalus appendiculatus]
MSACFRVNPSAETNLRTTKASRPSLYTEREHTRSGRNGDSAATQEGIRIGTEQTDRVTKSRRLPPRAAAITSAAVPEVGWTSKGRQPRDDVVVVFEAGRRDAVSPLSPRSRSSGGSHAPPSPTRVLCLGHDCRYRS